MIGGSEPAPKRSWDDPVEEGGLAAEDLGSRLSKEIVGQTDPVAKRGKSHSIPSMEPEGWQETSEKPEE